jgi:hypothetical protein
VRALSLGYINTARQIRAILAAVRLSIYRWFRHGGAASMRLSFLSAAGIYSAMAFRTVASRMLPLPGYIRTVHAAGGTCRTPASNEEGSFHAKRCRPAAPAGYGSRSFRNRREHHRPVKQNRLACSKICSAARRGRDAGDCPEPNHESPKIIES